MDGTDALRIHGTTNLIEAAWYLGARRFVTQSVVLGYGFGDHGTQTLTENSPFGVLRGDAFDPHLIAIMSAEEQVLHATGIDGIALRYGLLYGGDADRVIPRLEARRLPVSRAGGQLAFVHHDDAAAATVAALERGRGGGVYNVVDDAPATFSQLATAIADAAGAPRPVALPQWLLSAAAPFGGVVLGNVSMRVSNQKATSELGWSPRFPSYLDGVAALKP